MIQVWTMAGLHMPRAGDDPLGLMMAALDAEGFTSVVATNCEQTYHRYLEVGEQLQVTTRLDDVVGPKQTGARRRLVRHRPQHLVLGRRGGRRDAVPGAEVQAEAG